MILVVISQNSQRIDQILLTHILQFANVLLDGGNERI